jgi:hypothetical protein
LKNLRRTFVNDWISGANSGTAACAMFEEAVSVMKAAGMELAQWRSNTKLKILAEKADSGVDEERKVLGINWDPKIDCFSFSGVTPLDTLVTTKRVVLSCLTRIFDPLGFLNPFVMTGKCLCQCLWQRGLDWDEEVPLELHEEFAHWIEELGILKSWEIPRCYSCLDWGDFNQMELHSFGDASERGYGAVVYLRVQHADGKFTSSIVISKDQRKSI